MKKDFLSKKFQVWGSIYYLLVIGFSSVSTLLFSYILNFSGHFKFEEFYVLFMCSLFFANIFVVGLFVKLILIRFFPSFDLYLAVRERASLWLDDYLFFKDYFNDLNKRITKIIDKAVEYSKKQFYVWTLCASLFYAVSILIFVVDKIWH